MTLNQCFLFTSDIFLALHIIKPVVLNNIVKHIVIEIFRRNASKTHFMFCLLHKVSAIEAISHMLCAYFGNDKSIITIKLW